jgi:hypothetical protein
LLLVVAVAVQVVVAVVALAVYEAQLTQLVAVAV